jgi:hypothetical protein
MVPQVSLLVVLVDLVDAVPSPPSAQRRGHPPIYPDRLFLKALVIMLVRGVPTVGGLLVILAQPTAEMQALRARLTEGGPFPARRTWERRLKVLPATLPARIGCPGRALVALLGPWEACARSPTRTSTSSSRASSTPTARCRPGACCAPSAGRSGPCSSTNSPCCIAPGTAAISAPVSKPS